jgi:hypothetical protein
MGLSGVGLTTYSYVARVYLWADSRGRRRTGDGSHGETTTYSYDELSRTSRQDSDNGA